MEGLYALSILFLKVVTSHKQEETLKAGSLRGHFEVSLFLLEKSDLL